MDNTSEKLLNRREFIEKMAQIAAIVGVAGVLPTPGCSTSTSTDKTFDVLIKGGTIYDGTLSKPYIADIGIQGEKIAAIGSLPQKASKVIEASGLIVTPGFIDVHTHCDLTFKRAGKKRYLAYVMSSWKGNHNYLYQGVTTVVTGNCGYGYADTEYWFDLVNSLKFGTNVYHLVPHGIIRQELFGEQQPHELSMRQLEAMKKRVAEEMGKGAIGLSTGLEYAPGLLSTTQELIELAKVVRTYGGVYTSHVRDETGRIYADGKIGIVEAIKEAIEIAKYAEIPVEISHLKINKPINSVKPSQLLELIEKARMEGLDVTADQYPYDAGSSGLFYLLPNEFKSGFGVKEEFKTKEGRSRLKQAIEHVFSYLEPEKILITMSPENTSYEGKTLQEIADLEGKNPSESYVDLVCEDEALLAVFFAQDMDIVRSLMPHGYIITVSDGWTVPKNMTTPHPRTYGTFPKKLKTFAIEEKRMGFADAIRSMTSLPAEKFQMKERGKIAKDHYADIAVIDMNTLTDHATYRNPHQYSEGVIHLFVNGTLSIEHGKTTGARAGETLKKG